MRILFQRTIFNLWLLPRLKSWASWVLTLRLQPQSQYINRHVLISIHWKSAMRAGMDPNRQCFGDGYSTSETPLRCILGIHENHIRAGLFSFTLSDTDKHSPGHVSYAFGQIMSFLHVCDCQIFKGDSTIPNHQPQAGLMRKIKPPVADSFMNADNNFSGFFLSGVPFSAFESFLCAFARAFSSVRKNRGFSIFSPFERVAKDSMPTSIPTASSVCKSSFCRVSSGSYSTEKETSPFLVRERLYCTCIDPFPPIRRCRTTVTSQFLKEKESVLLHQAWIQTEGKWSCHISPYPWIRHNRDSLLLSVAGRNLKMRDLLSLGHPVIPENIQYRLCQNRETGRHI